MESDAARWSRLDRILWTIIAAIAAIVMASAAVSDFHLVWRSFLVPGVTTAVLVSGQWFYRRRRPDPRLAAALGATAQIVAFAAVGAPLSYLGASLPLPLHDAWLAGIDRSMGLDWNALFAWMNAHAALHPLFQVVYISLMPQTLVVILALGLAGRLNMLRIFVLAFFVATLVTIVIAAILPAQGVWGFLSLHPADYPDIMPAVHGTYLPTYLGLRDGSFRLLMASGAEGIITFPSLHAALALILAAALWRLPVLRWIGLALNVLMLISIPVDGGHYFIDIFAGLAIAALSLVAARWIAARAETHAVSTGAAPDPIPARQMAAPTG
jgi:membrane-associated phospholipid phosphatase